MKGANRITFVAVLVGALSLFCAVALGASEPDAAAVAEARSHYARGLALYNEGRNSEARAALENAYAIAPTYRLLYDLALASEGEGDLSSAIKYLRRYLVEGGAALEPARRTEAEGRLKRLRAHVALVTIRTNVAAGAAVAVDEQPAGEVSEDPLVLLPGTKKIWVTKAGYYPTSKFVLLKEGDAIELAFDLTELPRPAAPRPVAWWRSGTALLGLTAFLVVGLLTVVQRRRQRRSGGAMVQLNPYQEQEDRTAKPTPTQTNVITVDDAASADSTPLALVASATTDVGRVKPSNQDSHLVDVGKGLFVVADGIGGFAGGEVASATAVEAIGAYLAGAGPKDVGLLTHLPQSAAELASAVFNANAAIRQKQVQLPNLADMGSTCVAARFTPGAKQVTVVHVGDSRVYRLRAGQLTQLTTDHTMAELGVTGRRAQHLSRALGTESAPRVDVLLLHAEAADLYLLCCDGLTKMLTDAAITTILTASSSPKVAARDLVAKANEAGGLDNITALVIQVAGPS